MAAVAKEHGLSGEAGERVGEFVALALDVSRRTDLLTPGPLEKPVSFLYSPFATRSTFVINHSS